MTTEIPLEGKTALITGASRGIGSAVVHHLSKLGATPIITATDSERLALCAHAVACETGQKPLSLAADISDEGAVRRLIETVRRSHDRVDILVNNAGVTFSGSLSDTSAADWDRCMAINARGPFLLCREALPLLRRGCDPCIVNVSSVVGVKGYAQQTAYSASKHALRGFSIALAEELRGEGIRVHVICPGGVDTDMVEEVRPDISKEELIDPEEIAEIVAFLVMRPKQGIVDEIRIRRRSSAPWF